MKTDRVFVLLLVVLLPLSGCFDGSVGDADATEDLSVGTTIVNHYYNNTTNIQQIQNIPNLLVTSGTYGSCSSWTNTTDNGVTESTCNEWLQPAVKTYEFAQISANTTIRIHGVSFFQDTGFYGYVVCTSGFTSYIYVGATFTLATISTDGGDCSLMNGNREAQLGDWSMTYEIIPVTVI